MENVNELRRIIEKVLTEKAEFYRRVNDQKADENMVELVFDRERDSYLLGKYRLGKIRTNILSGRAS